MFDDPLSLQGVHSSNFNSKVQKITVLACPLEKIAQQAKKIARTCLRRLCVFTILHTTTEVLMISMMKTRELKFLSSLYLFRKSVVLKHPVSLSMCPSLSMSLCLKLEKTKLLWLMMLPRSQLGCLVCCGQESPHPAGTGDPTWPSSPCQPSNVAHCFANLTPGCLLPVFLICTRKVSYQMKHNPKTRVVAMRLVGNNRKFI